VSLTRDVAPLLDEAVPLLKQHARIEHDLEDALLAQYVEAAIDAAEHFLDRDVAPSVRKYLGNMEQGFAYRRGFVRSIKVETVHGQPVSWQTDWRVAYDRHPRTWGLIVDLRCYCRCPCDDGWGAAPEHFVLIEGGLESWKDTPADVRQFILAAASAMYEVREIANYTKVEDAAFLPLHLLASWANLSYA
jgi:hypothetical protein